MFSTKFQPNVEVDQMSQCRRNGFQPMNVMEAHQHIESQNMEMSKHRNDEMFYALRTVRGFWKYCKSGWGGFLAFESLLICCVTGEENT